MEKVRRKLDMINERARRILYSNLVRGNSPVHIAETVLSDTLLSDVHDHDFYEFFLVRKGSVTEYRQGKKTTHTVRSLVFVPPSVSHGFTKDVLSGETRFINVAFPTLYIKKLTAKLNISELTQQFEKGFIIKEVPLLLWSRINGLIQQLEPGYSHTFQVKEALFDILLMDLAGELLTQNITSERVDLPTWLRNCCNKMAVPGELKGGIGKMVRLSGKTQEHLTRTMKQFMKITPSEFLNQIRLETVIIKLKEGHMPIQKIAYAAGFFNLAHFNSVFRYKYGMTPREYRNRTSSDVVPISLN
jgi:AraC family cel operon transcriptional repressor